MTDSNAERNPAVGEKVIVKPGLTARHEPFDAEIVEVGDYPVAWLPAGKTAWGAQVRAVKDAGRPTYHPQWRKQFAWDELRKNWVLTTV